MTTDVTERTALTGGSGSVVGTALGVLLITTVRNCLNLLNVSPFWQTVAVGAIIVVSAILSQLRRRGGRGLGWGWRR